LVSGTVYYIRAYAINSGGTYYGDELIFKTSTVLCDTTVTDVDGNTYNSVTIGSQCWMKENLRTTRYNDATEIVTGLSDPDWTADVTGACASYNNNPANDLVYGKLYNWYAVNTGKLAPLGWHVPTAAEWTILINYLGGASICGNKMKATTLWAAYTGITNTNSSGFTALPTGVHPWSGGYYNISFEEYFWSSTQHTSASAKSFWLKFNSSDFINYAMGKNGGISVRCIKD
jgi:uncharacterized protein (TIGR02145 family)